MKTLYRLIAAGIMLVFTATLRAEVSAQAWLETYYLNPQPAQVPEAIRQLSRAGYFDRQENAATAIGFFGTVFANHPDRVEAWLDQVGELPDRHQRLVAAALWQAGHPRGETMLRTLAEGSSVRAGIERLARTPSQRIADTPVRSPSSMRLQWGAFLATGAERHIVSILEAIGIGEPSLDTAARVALVRNAADHPRVMQICQAQLERQPEEVRSVLRAALSAAPTPAPRS